MLLFADDLITSEAVCICTSAANMVSSTYIEHFTGQGCMLAWYLQKDTQLRMHSTCRPS